jgi:hypothetical protein
LSGQNIDLEKYKQITDQQLSTIPASIKVFESSIINKGNNEYYKADYEMTQGKLRLRINSICLIYNEKAYLLTFSAEFDKFDSYKKIGDEILNSFSLKK